MPLFYYGIGPIFLFRLHKLVKGLTVKMIQIYVDLKTKFIVQKY